MKLIFENWRKYLLKEADEVIQTNNAVVIFSDWAKGHIERGHKEPGKGSIFADFDLSLVNQALEQIELNTDQAVYTIQVPDVGYDLVLPNDEAKQLENAKQTEVEKEDRQGPITVNAYTTSQPLEDFLQDSLSVVIRPTSEIQYVPEALQKDPAILQAIEQGNLYSVLSAWPGRGDVPPANQWGDDWAVVIPNQDTEEIIEEAEYKGRKVKLNKRLPGDVKKFKVYVKGCGKDSVTKINFGDKKMKIKKNIPARRKSFRARHKCKTAKDKCTARYWSCKAW